MTISRKSFLIALAVVPAFSLSSVKAEESLTTIYSAKDLAGWKVPDNNIWWIAEDGILKLHSRS